MASTKKRQSWIEESDVILCREILTLRPYQYQKGSKESANAWNIISDIINNKIEQLSVTTKAVRDHFNLLISRRKAEKRNEERASGISVEEKEIDVLLDEIIEDEKNCAEVLSSQSEAKQKADNADKEKGEEMRQRAMESFGESRKRRLEEEDTPPKTKRRSGTDTLQYLAERNEATKLQHADEMKLRREELELKKQEAEQSRDQFNFMMQNMQMQLQMQQQQMNQQFQLQQQQMQQQTQLFAALLEKVNK